MKFLPGFIVSFLTCVVILVGFLIYTQSSSRDNLLNSPISFQLKNFILNSRSFKFWIPNSNVMPSISSTTPEIRAKAALSYDLSSSVMLYSKNIDEKLPIASLTKIMTAIVALETKKEADILTVGRHAASIGEDSMGLSAGEKLTVKDLLYGLFLQSGNDAAEVIADADTLGRSNFIHLMNKKAEDMGLSDTHFTNPTGLEGDGKQYSTTRDLLVITKYALELDLIRNIVQTYSYSIPFSNTHKSFELYNETNLLTTYPGVKGVKTGFTDEAGLCLITYLEYNNHKIIAILLNSPSRREEMTKILDFSLESLGVKPPKHS